MDVFILKNVAMITMLCDHLGESFLGDLTIYRCIGRFAFPIYAILLAEGFRHFKDDPKRVSKHLGDYVILALVSELAYDLLEAKPFIWSNMVISQNNIITLLIAFLGLMAIDKWKDKPLPLCSVILLTAFSNYFIGSNYRFAGVLLVYAFYFYLNWAMEKDKGYLQRFGMLLLIMTIYLPIYHWARYDFCNWTMYLEYLKGANTYWYLTHIAIAGFLATYTGKLGYSSKGFKKFYKWFYPGHLAILGIIHQIM